MTFLKRISFEFPALLLLIFVYLFVFPRSLSYDHSWVQPEQFFIKMGILKSGPSLNPQDLKNGLYWQLFEYQPRSTRPLSSYFEIIDTKFRVWLWQYVMPHPSLSLTWIFSLFLGPLFLYKLLRNYEVGKNLAIAMIAFYLATPSILSSVVLLFRPGKPMTNFVIIFSLYLASQLKKKFIDQQQAIPLKSFLFFWLFVVFSFYWDEGGLLIFPAILIFFNSLFHRKLYLFLWLCLPAITALAYFKIIPYLSCLAGFSFPHFDQALKFFSGLAYKEFSSNYLGGFIYFLKMLIANTKILILETMGIVFPQGFRGGEWLTGCFLASLVSWIVIIFKLFKARKKSELFLFSIFLFGLILFFNYLISLVLRIWGPYYYGGFWSIFFAIFLARFINKTDINKHVLVVCFFFIILNMSNSFLAINLVNKKYHYYPYSPGEIRLFFKGDRNRFDVRPFYSGGQIKEQIYDYWMTVRRGDPIKQYYLPRELCWLPLELEPTKPHTRHEVLRSDSKFVFPAY